MSINQYLMIITINCIEKNKLIVKKLIKKGKEKGRKNPNAVTTKSNSSILN